METVYIVTLAAGAVLLVASVFTGGEHGHAHQGEVQASDSSLAALLGVRFWTYFAACFGAAGLLLTNLTGLGGLTVGLLSAGTGAAAGVGVTLAARSLARGQTPVADAQAFTGQSGRLLVAIRGGAPGKVRCTVRGELVDLTAVADGDAVLEAGLNVMIIGFDGTRAIVVKED